MSTLKKSKTILNIYNFIRNNSNIFISFDQVFLFGSTLTKNKKTNDIDLLLIYPKYSKDILLKIKEIKIELNLLLNIQIDTTILSLAELKETNFLNKIKNYLRLK